MAAVQQSAQQATLNGINALETAKAGVTRCREDVLATQGNLSAGYQGSDGKGFYDLLGLWDEQVGVILKNLQDVIDSLDTSNRTHGQTQSGATEGISTAVSMSNGAFDALAG
ncbi:hypothetical protein [Streptomyces sp. NPDC000880]